MCTNCNKVNKVPGSKNKEYYNPKYNEEKHHFDLHIPYVVYC